MNSVSTPKLSNYYNSNAISDNIDCIYLLSQNMVDNPYLKHVYMSDIINKLNKITDKNEDNLNKEDVVRLHSIRHNLKRSGSFNLIKYLPNNNYS